MSIQRGKLLNAPNLNAAFVSLTDGQTIAGQKRFSSDLYTAKLIVSNDNTFAANIMTLYRNTTYGSARFDVGGTAYFDFKPNNSSTGLVLRSKDSEKYLSINTTETNAVIAYNNFTNGLTLDSSGNGIITGNLTATGGTLTLNNGTSNMLSFGTGTAAPAFTTRSAGTKLILNSALASNAVDYGIGVETSAAWYSIPQATSTFSHRFYGGTTELMRIRGDGNVGLGRTDPGERLDVAGNIRLGGADAGPNFIAFRGTPGDGPGSYNHTYIGERRYGGTEQSELVLFKGNDIEDGPGPDRIRMIGANHVFDTYTAPTSGTFEAVSTSANLATRMIIRQDGKVGIGNIAPSEALDVTGNLKASGTLALGAHFTAGTGVNAGYFQDANNGAYRAIGTTGDRGFFFQNNDGAATTMYVGLTGTYAGRVGIGTNTPGADLQITDTTTTSTAIFNSSGAKTATYVSAQINETSTSSTASIIKTGLSISSTGTWNGTSAVNRGLHVTATGGTNNYAAIFENGFVGIGTTAPTADLHIVDTTTTPTFLIASSGAKTATYAGAQINETSTSSTASVTKTGFTITSTGTWNGTGAVNRALYVNATGGTANYAAIFENGFVGVGTTTPNYRMQIADSSNSAEVKLLSIINTNVGNNTASAIRFGNSSDLVANNGVAELVAIRTNAVNGGDTDFVIRTATGETINERARFMANGNVGLGTAAPTANLHVVGATTTTTPTGLFHSSGAKTASYASMQITDASTSSTGSITKTGLSISSTGTWNGDRAINRGLHVTATGGASNYAAIFESGFVGIGTTGPTADLHIVDETASPIMILTSSGAKTAEYTGSSVFELSTSSTASITKTGFAINSTGQWNGANSVNRALYVNATGGTNNYAAIFERGFVGIGTTAPTADLHVVDTTTSPIMIFNSSGDKTVSYTGSQIIETSSSTTASIVKTGLSISSTGTWTGTGATNRALYATATGGTNNYAAIFESGFVGIGTTAPTTPLQVSGTVGEMFRIASSHATDAWLTVHNSAKNATGQFGYFNSIGSGLTLVIQNATTNGSINFLPSGTGKVTINGNDVLSTSSYVATTPSALAATAAAGTNAAPARIDHVHPTTGLMTTSHAANSIAGFSDANPSALGTAAQGTSTRVSRQDHVHPTTGLMTTSHAANSITGFGTSGTSTLVARADHTHASGTGNYSSMKLGDNTLFPTQAHITAAWDKKVGEAGYNWDVDFNNDGIVDMFDQILFNDMVDSSLEVGGPAKFGGTISVHENLRVKGEAGLFGGVRSPSYKSGGFEMKYNETQKSLDFIFSGR